MENNPTILNLESRKNYLSLKKNGKRIFTKTGIIFNFKHNSINQSRLGWTVPKYVGNAVIRNKLKRFCRESIRNQNTQINILSLDINIIFTNKDKDYYKNLRFIEVENAIKEFIYKFKKGVKR